MTISDPFADRKYGQQTTMQVNGFKVTLNMPKAVSRLKNADGSEGIAGLPPYNPRVAFAVDEYPASPDSWMHGSGKASSYFVPILAEHGMWLDFTSNAYHSHHLAAVISVQGVNPLTALKADPIRLEQYRENCPKHNIAFQQDRFCPTCRFKWHPQNYLSSNNGSPFWIDGFRTEEGVIRQWFFTEEECKGVAAQILGAERVFAIGIAFFESKEPKPAPVRRMRGSYNGGPEYFCSAGLETLGSTMPTGFLGCSDKKLSARKSYGAGRQLGARGLSRSLDSAVEAVKSDVEQNQKRLEIGAGAKIHQTINPDPEGLDFWKPEPSGMIYINYCDVATAEKILAAGKRQELSDGPLAGLNLKD